MADGYIGGLNEDFMVLGVVVCDAVADARLSGQRGGGEMSGYGTTIARFRIMKAALLLILLIATAAAPLGCRASGHVGDGGVGVA